MFHNDRECAPQPFLPERIRDRGLVANVQLFHRAPPSPHCAGKAQNGETGLSPHVPLQLLHLRVDDQVNFFMGCDCHIEVFFRTLKQTFGCRKLRSRSARNAQLELEWSLVGLWGVCLLGTRALSAGGHEPARLSPAAAIRAFQRTLREYRVRPETPADTLWGHLRRARLDDYQRRAAKTSQAYPRKKQRPPIGIPHLPLATTQQIAQAAALQHQQEFRLAA
jgi:hypothetical protein